MRSQRGHVTAPWCKGSPAAAICTIRISRCLQIPVGVADVCVAEDWSGEAAPYRSMV